MTRTAAMVRLATHRTMRGLRISHCQTSGDRRPSHCQPCWNRAVTSSRIFAATSLARRATLGMTQY
jgi:hypothetical protein